MSELDRQVTRLRTAEDADDARNGLLCGKKKMRAPSACAQAWC